MTLNEVREMLESNAVVPLWPQTGAALNLSRWSTYEAANRGDILTIQIGRLKRVPTTWLSQKLGLDRPAA